MPAPAITLARSLVATALGVALLAGPVHAQDNEVDEAVEATVDAAGDVADTISGAASAAADEVADSATWDRIAGNWKRLSGSAKQRWGELTDDDVARIDGEREQLVGKVQETYGITRMQAEQEVDAWAADRP